MINRNAYHNAMRCGTLLSAPRPDAQHRATPLFASQRNSTICLFYYTAARRAAAPLDSAQRHSTIFLSSTHCYAAHRYATRLNAAICLLSLRRSSAQRSASHLYSTICLSSAQLSYANRTSTLCISSQRFFYHQRAESIRGSRPLNSAQRNAMLFNSTICLLSSRLFELHFFEPRLDAAHRHSTQRFVCYQRSASPLGYPPRTAPRLGSTLRNDLFVIYASQRISTQQCASHLYST